MTKHERAGDGGTRLKKAGEGKRILRNDERLKIGLGLDARINLIVEQVNTGGRRFDRA